MGQKQALRPYFLFMFSLARALIHPALSVTATAHDALQPGLPEETPVPDADIEKLRRRSVYYDSYGASGGSVTGGSATTTYTSWASASVCGFVDGVLDYSSEIACYGYTQCVFHTANNAFPGIVGCCDNSYSQKCQFETTCYDRNEVAATPTLTEEPFAILCTRSSAPSCMTWTYPELSITDYGCSDIVTIQTLYLEAAPYSNNFPNPSSLSYLNGIPTVASVVGSVIDDAFVSGYLSNAAAATSQNNMDKFISSGITSTFPNSATSTGSSSGSGSGSGSSSSHHSSTGAIAGGVVGGAVGLAGIGAAIFMFFLFQKKKKNKMDPGMVYQAAPADNAPTDSIVSPTTSSLPPPSEVDGASIQRFAPAEVYGTEHKFHSVLPAHEMDATHFIAELPTPQAESRPVSHMYQGKTSYSGGSR